MSHGNELFCSARARREGAFHRSLAAAADDTIGLWPSWVADDDRHDARGPREVLGPVARAEVERSLLVGAATQPGFPAVDMQLMNCNEIHSSRGVPRPVAIGALLLTSCVADGLVASDVGLTTSRLELACGPAPADVTGDVLAILPSIDPFDPDRPQPYGSDSCSGVVFEFANPDEEPLRGAWIHASWEFEASGGALGDSPCHERALEADYWGYEEQRWTKLASASTVGRLDEDSEAAYCRVEAVIEHAATFKKLRVVARVSRGSETYPMHASLW